MHLLLQIYKKLVIDIICGINIYQMFNYIMLLKQIQINKF
jgi:hypothetical protein